jgi:hypothetical protein
MKMMKKCIDKAVKHLINMKPLFIEGCYTVVVNTVVTVDRNDSAIIEYMWIGEDAEINNLSVMAKLVETIEEGQKKVIIELYPKIDNRIIKYTAETYAMLFNTIMREARRKYKITRKVYFMPSDYALLMKIQGYEYLFKAYHPEKPKYYYKKILKKIKIGENVFLKIPARRYVSFKECPECREIVELKNKYDSTYEELKNLLLYIDLKTRNKIDKTVRIREGKSLTKLLVKDFRKIERRILFDDDGVFIGNMSPERLKKYLMRELERINNVIQLIKEEMTKKELGIEEVDI